MSTIVTRAGKGSALTHNEVDANFVNLNTDKLQSGDTAAALTITSATINGGTFSGSSITNTSLTSGRVTFASTGGLLADSANLFWDNTNARLGIGTASPQDTLEISKSGGAYLRLSNSNTASVSEAIGGIKFYSADASGSQNIVRTLIESYTNAIGATSDLRFSTTPDGVGATPIERMRINTEGNLGLGVTPSAWAAGNWNAFQLGRGASIAGRVVAGLEDQVYVSTNAYNDGAWKYIATNNAANYYQDNGEHVWRTAPSGTAGTAITFTTAMTLNASGNLGLGVTPSAWNLSGYEALEVGAVGNGIFSGNNDTIITANAYYNAGWKYAANYQATFYEQNAGAHIWKTAATGTAGNAITFTQAMTLDASGNLGIGIGSLGNTRIASYDTNATVYTSTGATAAPVGSIIAIGNLSNTNGGYSGITFGANQAAGTSSGTYIGNFSNAGSLTGTMVFGRRTGSAAYAESMRIDSSGNLGLGVTPSASAKLDVNGAIFIRNINVKGILSNPSGDIFDIANAGGGSSNPITFTTQSVERMRIPSSGGVQAVTTISVGNATPSTSGAGITFPATQSASTDANTLDDYEEGTFTPTIIGTTTAGTGTYSANSQIGRYTRIGNRVYFNIYLVWTAHTGTGNMRISGLPFTSIATTNTFNAVSTWNANIALTASNLLTAYVNVNATTVELRQYSTGGGADAAIPIDTAGSIMVAGHYEV